MQSGKGIPERLREARELVDGLAARELDHLARVSLGLAWMIESNHRPNPTAKVVTSYCDVLGISCDWLLRGRGEEPSQAAVVASVERARRRARKAA